MGEMLSFEVVKYPVVVSDFAMELVEELRCTRAIVRKSRSKTMIVGLNSELQVGDLVMLKVQPRYRLHRSYQGPFKIKSLTATNAVIIDIVCQGVRIR